MFKSKKDYYRLFQKQRNYDFLATMLAMFGLIIGVADWEYQIRNDLTAIDMKKYPDPNSHPRTMLHWCNKSNHSKLVIAITTFMAMICMFVRYKNRKIWLNKYFKDETDPRGIEFIHYVDES